MIRAATSAIIAAAALLTGGQAQAQSRTYEPQGAWSVEQRDEYCALSREFGGAGEPVTLYFYSYGPMGSLRITLEGEDLPRNSNKARIGSAGFGDEADMQDLHVIVGQRGDAGTLNFLTYRPDGGLRFGYAWSAEWDVSMDVWFDPQATRLTVDTDEMEPLALELGPVAEALADLRACEEALFDSWNLEVPPATQLASPPVIENGRQVVRAIIRPPAMLINRSSQMVQVRLVINEAGEVDDCVLQSPNWRPRDARGVCRKFRDIGEYQPARNAAGEAVPGLLRGYYLMLIYD